MVHSSILYSQYKYTDVYKLYTCLYEKNNTLGDGGGHLRKTWNRLLLLLSDVFHTNSRIIRVPLQSVLQYGSGVYWQLKSRAAISVNSIHCLQILFWRFAGRVIRFYSHS